jgi:hypothetical protein
MRFTDTIQSWQDDRGFGFTLFVQQVLRHKSNKATFRAAFWATVVAKVAGFVFLHSPWGAGWRV